jgi:hypothetical protein
MSKINTYQEFIDNIEILMPVNFKFMRKVEVLRFQLPYKLHCQGYECTYFFRNKFYKPLNIV